MFKLNIRWQVEECSNIGSKQDMTLNMTLIYLCLQTHGFGFKGANFVRMHFIVEVLNMFNMVFIYQLWAWHSLTNTHGWMSTHVVQKMAQ